MFTRTQMFPCHSEKIMTNSIAFLRAKSPTQKLLRVQSPSNVQSLYRRCDPCPVRFYLRFCIQNDPPEGNFQPSRWPYRISFICLSYVTLASFSEHTSCTFRWNGNAQNEALIKRRIDYFQFKSHEWTNSFACNILNSLIIFQDI